MEETDTELLEEVARGTDPQAFARLYARHESELFGLAMRITRHRELAAEALQKAMLGAWRGAATFEGTDLRVRAWLLQIVARASISLLRSARMSEVKKARALAAAEAREEAPPSDRLEREQLLAQLGRLVEDLPEPERQLIALYYGGSLSQQEIAATLAMPRRTVAYKLDETLKSLRVALARTGHLAVSAALAEETVSRAVCAGFAAPPDLSARVLERISATGSLPGRGDAPGVAPQAARAVTPAAAAIIAAGILVAGGAGLVLTRTDREAPTANSEAGPFQVTWDFDRGPARDLKAVQGAWRWDRSGNGGRMVLNPERDVLVRLPLDLPRRPFLITVQAYFEARSPGRVLAKCRADWVNDQGMLPHRVWGHEYSVNDPALKIDFDYALYFFDQDIVTQLNGRHVHLQRYPQAYPARNVVLCFRSFKITKIVAHSLEPSAIPPAVRSLRAEVERLGWKCQDVNERGESTPAQPRL